MVVDDLGVVGLNYKAPKTPTIIVNYPNYRMGGGNLSGRKLHDCLLLDIRHSDAILTLEQKLKLANELKVTEGRRALGSELSPTIKGEHVVFYVSPFGGYMTLLEIETRDGRGFVDVIAENLPRVRGGNGKTAPTALLYVRDCRL